MQLERHFARQHFRAALQCRIQNGHAHFEGFKKAFFFGLQHRRNALGLASHVGVGIAHELDQVRHKLVEERFFLAQQIPVANGATDDAALHIATAFVARHHAIAHQERGSANVVSNHPQALVAHVGATGFA